MIIIVNAEKENVNLSSPSDFGKHTGQPADEAQPYSDLFTQAIEKRFYLISFLQTLGYTPAYEPLGALLAPFYEVGDECFIVSPIHWEASHNDVLIKASGKALRLSESLNRVWFHEMSQFLAEDGFRLIYHDQDHWLVAPDRPRRLRAPAVSAMYNRSMMPILSALDDTLYWQRLMTEIQMFMSNHPLNKQKNQLFKVNGLWFWGGGALDLPLEKSLYTDSPVIQKAYPAAKSLNLIDFKEKNFCIVLAQYDPVLIANYEKQLRYKPVQWVWNQCDYTNHVRRFSLSRLLHYFGF